MRLVFPVREEPKLAACETFNDSSAISALRVLFVDDEPLLRQLVRSMLENDGHQVTVADGGKSALAEFRQALQRNPFDVVITDLGMPDVDGRKLAQLLKDESPATPVIMLTGWGTLMRADGDLPARVDYVLGKPPRIREMRNALRTVSRPNAVAEN